MAGLWCPSHDRSVDARTSRSISSPCASSDHIRLIGSVERRSGSDTPSLTGSIGRAPVWSSTSRQVQEHDDVADLHRVGLAWQKSTVAAPGILLVHLESAAASPDFSQQLKVQLRRIPPALAQTASLELAPEERLPLRIGANSSVACHAWQSIVGAHPWSIVRAPDGWQRLGRAANVDACLRDRSPRQRGHRAGDVDLGRPDP